jgi:hypothetical protein
MMFLGLPTTGFRTSPTTSGALSGFGFFGGRPSLAIAELCD